MKKVFALILIMAFLGLSGCGANPEKAKEDQGESKAEAKMQLVEEGKLTFAMSGLYKPLNYKQDGKLVGFDVEIGTEIAKRLGLEANPVTNPWETILQGLKGKKYDAIIGSMSITEDRAKQVDFTIPYYIEGAQIFVAEGNQDIKTPEDLKGRTIGVIQSSVWKSLAEGYSDKIKSYPSDVYALQDLPSGRVEAVITDNIVGAYAIKENGLKLKAVGSVLNKDEVAVAVNKDNPELTKKISEAIQAMVEDGTYEQISVKWFGYNTLKE